MKAVCRFGIILGNFMVLTGIIQFFTEGYWILPSVWWITIGYCSMLAGGIFFPTD